MPVESPVAEEIASLAEVAETPEINPELFTDKDELDDLLLNNVMEDLPPPQKFDSDNGKKYPEEEGRFRVLVRGAIGKYEQALGVKGEEFEGSYSDRTIPAEDSNHSTASKWERLKQLRIEATSRVLAVEEAGFEGELPSYDSELGKPLPKSSVGKLKAANSVLASPEYVVAKNIKEIGMEADQMQKEINVQREDTLNRIKAETKAQMAEIEAQHAARARETEAAPGTPPETTLDVDAIREGMAASTEESVPKLAEIFGVNFEELSSDVQQELLDIGDVDALNKRFAELGMSEGEKEIAAEMRASEEALERMKQLNALEIEILDKTYEVAMPNATGEGNSDLVEDASAFGKETFGINPADSIRIVSGEVFAEDLIAEHGAIVPDKQTAYRDVVFSDYFVRSVIKQKGEVTNDEQIENMRDQLIAIAEDPTTTLQNFRSSRS